VHQVPVAQLLGQVTPGCAGAGDPEDGIERAPMVSWRAATQRPPSVTNGSKNPHSSSVKRPRITADLPHEDQGRITPRRVGGNPFRAICPRGLEACCSGPICAESIRLIARQRRKVPSDEHSAPYLDVRGRGEYRLSRRSRGNSANVHQ
jgi:hypothetical protein